MRIAGRTDVPTAPCRRRLVARFLRIVGQPATWVAIDKAKRGERLFQTIADVSARQLPIASMPNRVSCLRKVAWEQYPVRCRVSILPIVTIAVGHT